MLDEFGGQEAHFEQLDLAGRVRVWYEWETGAATRALVLARSDGAQ